MNKFYITNAIPYVNAKPHIGHALEFIQSDTIARYHKFILKDDLVSLSCGYDENSLKNVQAAEAEGISVQELVNKNGQLFFKLWEKLGSPFDEIVKGSDSRHIKSSQELWRLCEKSGDIYKKIYKGLYCVGCEQFYEKNELNENGECFEHPGKPLEEISEENYFFKLSKYRNHILKLIESNEIEIIPEFRKNEIISFIKKGLEDISISRTNKRAKNWGVPVPNDSEQRMYVWFDALNIYQTAAGFNWNLDRYNKLWPADLHVIGKGIIRFHAVYWPAFLLSAGLSLPKALFVHGYLTVNRQKMSKSLGNVADPIEFIDKYGADALRYYLLREISPFQDGDFSEEKLIQAYNSDLANGLGNLIARVAKLCENANFQKTKTVKNQKHVSNFDEDYKKALAEYRFNDCLSIIWDKISRLDKFINDEKPWELVKNQNQRLKSVLEHAVDQIQEISQLLKPFLPETADKISKQFETSQIKSQTPLFPRI